MINDHGLVHLISAPYWPPKTPPRSVAPRQRCGTDGPRAGTAVASSISNTIMAGGMSRGDGTPLQDRVRAGGAATAAVDRDRGRHCWVVDPPARYRVIYDGEVSLKPSVAATGLPCNSHCFITPGEVDRQARRCSSSEGLKLQTAALSKNTGLRRTP